MFPVILQSDVWTSARLAPLNDLTSFPETTAAHF